MSLKHGILGFLNFGKMTGYELNTAFSKSIDFFWHAQISQIYRELSNLEKNGLVKQETIIQHDKPNKKEYTITPEGKEELYHWLMEFSRKDITDLKSEFLMKIFFSDSITVEESIYRLEQYKLDCMEFLDALQQVPITIQHYSPQVKNAIAPIYWELTSDFGELYMKACIKWAEQSIVKLKEAIK